MCVLTRGVIVHIHLPGGAPIVCDSSRCAVLDGRFHGLLREDIDPFLTKGDAKTDGGACSCRGPFSMKRLKCKSNIPVVLF